MRTAYFDCFSGAAGDMILASLIDAGADCERLLAKLNSLGLTGYSLSCQRVKKQGIAATYFKVDLTTEQRPHRHLKHVLEIIGRTDVSQTVRSRAVSVFTRLAQAEAKVHNTTVEKVHFHEVGAVDAIIDILGSAIALEMLEIDAVVCSPIPVGSGTIQCDHGIMPVPAPATAELLLGVPIASCDEVGELTTPTGAAILTTLASSFGPMPAMTPAAVGYGAGTRDGKSRPNVLRVVVGDAHVGHSTGLELVCLLETNLDDTTPQTVAYCVERLLEAGALDAWTQPIHMKKNRSGVMLSVLCETACVEALERIMFMETPTLGIRRKTVERRVLPRRLESISTRFGDIRMKIGELAGIVTATPEYEDCKSAALRHRVPLREVLTEARTAWRQKSGS